MDKFIELMDEKAKEILEEMSFLEKGSEELDRQCRAFKSVAEAYTKAYETRNKIEMDEKKFESESKKNELEDNRANEQNLIQLDTMKNENKQAYIKLGIDAALIVAQLIFWRISFKEGMKFEESGSYASMFAKQTTGRMNDLLKAKR